MKAFLIILAIILVFYLIVCRIILQQIVFRKEIKVPKFILNMIAGNEMNDEFYINHEKACELFLKKNIEHLQLTTKNNVKLKGIIFESEKPSKNIIIACHGARSSGVGEYCYISDFLHNNNFNLLLMDHRGCGESDGKFMGYGTHESQDTMLWVNYARERFGDDCKIILYGTSMGGATVLMMSDMNLPKNVIGIVADCSYTSAWDEFKYQLKNSFHLPVFPILHTVNFMNIILNKYSFKQASPIKHVKNAKLPILFIHGGKDDFVPTYMVDELYSVCPTKKSKVIISNAIHARSYHTDSKTYEETMSRFFNEFLQ